MAIDEVLAGGDVAVHFHVRAQGPKRVKYAQNGGCSSHIHLHAQDSTGGLEVISARVEGDPLANERYRLSRWPSRESVALVGKGITFDSGGYNLKPTGGILGMKMDMAGAATVLGVFDALGTLRPDVEVHGYVSTCENLVNGH